MTGATVTTSDGSAPVAPARSTTTVDAWAAGYLAAEDAERRLVEAAEQCIVRWGIRKTSLDDIAREAGVSRATVYRVFPGGKDRVVEGVLCHVVGRFFHELDAELVAAPSLDELLVVGVGALLREAVDNPVLPSLLEREPDLVLPHFAFHRFDRIFALAEAVSRPHLERFLPPAAVRPAAELLARCVLSFAFQPVDWLDPHDDAAVGRLVTTYLVPALTGLDPDRPATPWEHLA
ncbi:MAG TPA: TetR/AcrR family transcriptional regulator [Acidimicrobiales bacterium]|nr:TetR/AcrR family transcriptional regulator [Acidimicrobiales bacterium]